MENKTRPSVFPVRMRIGVTTPSGERQVLQATHRWQRDNKVSMALPEMGRFGICATRRSVSYWLQSREAVSVVGNVWLSFEKYAISFTPNCIVYCTSCLQKSKQNVFFPVINSIIVYIFSSNLARSYINECWTVMVKAIHFTWRGACVHPTLWRYEKYNCDEIA